MIKQLIALVATSGLAMKLVQHLSDKRQTRRTKDDHVQHRDDVSRWEAEGGNLPATKTAKAAKAKPARAAVRARSTAAAKPAAAKSTSTRTRARAGQ